MDATLTISSLLLVFSLTLGALAHNTRETDDQRFETLARDYIQKYLEMNPEQASDLGDHRFDSRLDDHTPAQIERRRKFDQEYLKAMSQISPANLSKVNSVDYRIMRTRIEYDLFRLDTLREYEWNPLQYNFGNPVYTLVARDYAPLKERLLSVRERLKQIPGAVAQAKANLKNPPAINTETAIQQNQGAINLIRNDLKQFIEQVPDLKVELASAQSEAISALEVYGKWLREELLPRSTADFRLGEQKFRQKLKFALDSDLTKEEILARAEPDLKVTQDTMYEVAVPLYTKYFPQRSDAAHLKDQAGVVKAVLTKLTEAHPTNDTIVPLAKQELQRATNFVRTNNLVTVPSEPVKVIVLPEFKRGVAVASCDSAGPFEKNGETFFEISPTPSDWTNTRVESFFREYNNYMVQDLTVHEAMPGHYVQLAHANKFSAPTKVRAIFNSGSFIEGWAVYAEQLMAERGYGGPEVRMQQLKMRLRVIINAIIDQKIHTAGMTEKEAIEFMMNEGYQEEGEAAGKWRRARLSSTQLSTYYVGNLEVSDIRKAYEAKLGRPVDYRRMHDLMLSFGSPAPKYVKELMGL